MHERPNTFPFDTQVPIYEVMSDGSANFQGALVIAGHYPINEVIIVMFTVFLVFNAELSKFQVTLYFNHKLFRGNRATKRSAEGFDAFESPNYPVLANVGTSIKGLCLDKIRGLLYIDKN